MKKSISRRTALKGFGTAVALPFLESLAGAAPATSAAAGAPKRLAFIYVPNGVNMPEWTPKAEGKLKELTGTLKPLDPFKEHVNVLSGLACDKARANGDGPGDHARAMSSFLTGRQARKTHGADIKVGVSADQHVATASDSRKGRATAVPKPLRAVRREIDFFMNGSLRFGFR